MVTVTYQVGEHKIEAYHDPLTNLSLAAQQTLIGEFMPVAQNGFDGQTVDEESVRQHLLKTSTTIVIRHSFNQIVGVAGSSILDIDGYKIIYLQGGVISKDCRDHGLYRLAMAGRILAEVKKLEPVWTKNKKLLIAGRTQSPIVYKFMHRKLGTFPNPDGYIDKDLKNKAKKLVKNIYEQFSDFQSSQGCIFDDNVFVARRSFGTILDDQEIGINLYGNSIPFCKNDNMINEYMIRNINWNNGDALIMLGYYRPQAVLSLFHGQKIKPGLPLAA